PDPQWQMLSVSRGCTDLTGYTVEALVGPQGIPYVELIHPEDRAHVWDTIQAALNQRAPFTLHYRLLTEDGSVKHVWEQGRGIWTERGALVAMEGFITDVTKQVNAQQALEESEARYRTLFNNVPVGLYRTRPDGQFVDTNEALARILGHEDRAGVLQTNANDYYLNRRDRERLNLALDANGGEFIAEVQIRRIDGETIWVRDYGRVASGDDGQIIYYEGSLEDVTERRRAETAEREQRALADALSQAIHAASRSLDIDTVTGEVLASLRYVVPHDTASIALFDAGTAAGDMVCACGVVHQATMTEANPQRDHHLDPAFVERVLEAGRALIIPNIREEPGWKSRPASCGCSGLAAPIKAEGNTIGILVLTNRTTGYFNAEHARRLEVFADQVVVAMRNAQLYEELAY